jgi:protocatechuate 3,4-dioxygenase beta subunit
MRLRRCAIAFLLIAASVTAQAQVARDRQSTPRDKPAEPIGTGVIAGVVLTADERQQPVRRASLLLASGQIVTPRTAVTDDAGRFEFVGLAPGNYTLVGQKPAWVPAVYGARSPNDTQGIPIAVTNGQRVENVRLNMMRGGVVSGIVRLPGGQPAQDVLVQVMRVNMVDGQRQLTLANGGTQTNDLGSYRVFGLAPGDYVVQAAPQAGFQSATATRQVSDSEVRWADQLLQQAQSSASMPPPPVGPAVTHAAVYFPGTSFASDAAIVAIRAGEERGNTDFAFALTPTAKLSGTVIGVDGAPVGGAQVQLSTDDNAGGLLSFMMRMMGASGRATSRPDGSFVLSGVTPGRYTLTARATPPRPGPPTATSAMETQMAEAMAMAAAMGGLFGGGMENPATLWAAEPFDISGQDVGPVTLTLREGLKIEGSIVVEGGTVPADVATLRVMVSKPQSGDAAQAMFSRALGSSTGVPKPDGSFTVNGLMPGKYQVTVTGKPMRLGAMVPGLAPAQAGYVVKSIRWNGRDLADDGVDVQADVPMSGVVVTLTSQPAELTGTVTDAAGRPTGAFPIVVFSTEKTYWDNGSRRVVQAQPASDGRFTVVGLPAGEYFLAAVTRLEPGDLASRQFLEELVPASLRVSIRDGEKKTQDVKLAGGG